MLSNRLTEGLKFSEDHRVESDAPLSGFGRAENGGAGGEQCRCGAQPAERQGSLQVCGMWVGWRGHGANWSRRWRGKSRGLLGIGQN